MVASKESPVNVDENLSPHPVNRRLFPSPRKPGEFKSLDDSDQGTNAGPAQRSMEATPTVQEDEQPDKENLPPPQLVDGAMSLSFEFPTSPSFGTPNSRSLAALLKTPTKSLSPPKLPGAGGTPQTPSRAIAFSPFSAHLFRTPVGGLVSPERWRSTADDGEFQFNLDELDYSQPPTSDGVGSGALDSFFDMFEDSEAALAEEGG
jgi:hypothetical protein